MLLSYEEERLLGYRECTEFMNLLSACEWQPESVGERIDRS